MAGPANGHFGKAEIELNTPWCCSGPEPVAMATEGKAKEGEALEPCGPLGASGLPELRTAITAYSIRLGVWRAPQIGLAREIQIPKTL